MAEDDWPHLILAGFILAAAFGAIVGVVIQQAGNDGWLWGLRTALAIITAIAAAITIGVIHS